MQESIMAQDCDLRDHPIDAAHGVVPEPIGHRARIQSRPCWNENWEFAALRSLMRSRCASINDIRIAAAGRKYHCPQGRRPDDHPGLSASGH
jgi:nuclear transport factor 2 (NTF2) superfamily protein